MDKRMVAKLVATSLRHYEDSWSGDSYEEEAVPGVIGLPPITVGQLTQMEVFTSEHAPRVVYAKLEGKWFTIVVTEGAQP